jgi:plastocyanin
MKRSWLVIGLIVLILLGVGMAWLLMTQATPKSSTSTSTTNSSSSSSASTPPAASSSATDETSSSAVTVAIKDEAFSPQSIKIKKGTKVTWVNDDNIQHSVVADDSGNPDSMPTDNSAFGKGGTYSFTFNTVGTVSYHCSIHSFMTGTIEVVD